MRGTVRAKGRCAYCGGVFRETPTEGGMDLVCACDRRPRRGIYIDLYWGKPSTRRKIYADRFGDKFTAPEQAFRTLTRIRGEIDSKTFDPRQYEAKRQFSLLLKSWAPRWLKTRQNLVKRGGITQSTYESQRRAVETYILPRLERRELNELRGIVLEEFAADLTTHPTTAAPVAPNTQATVTQVLNKMLRDAYTWGDLEKPPVYLSVHRPDPGYRAPSFEDQRRILSCIEPRHRPLFLMFGLHPIRVSEARALQLRDVNLDAGTFKVRRTFSGAKDEIREHRKAGAEYELPIHPDMLPILRAVVASRPDAHPTAFLFLNPGMDGMRTKPLPNPAPLTHYPRTTVTYIWRRACQSAGVPYIPPKDGTRHFIASEAVNRGVDIGAVSSALGHSSLAITQKYYAKYRPEGLRRVIEIDRPQQDRPETGPGTTADAT